jgi:hypothetical protein
MSEENTKALTTLPALPEHQIEVWERLCSRMKDCPTRRGVYFLLAGWTYRQAGKAAGVAHSALTDAAERYGLRPAIHTSGRAVLNHRALEIATTEELLERHRNGEFRADSSRDLAVIAGISRDKVAAFEQKQEGNVGALTLLERIAGGLAERGMRLDVSLSPAEAAPEEKTVRNSRTDEETPALGPG